MRADRLQGRSGLHLGMAVIHDQSGPALIAKPTGNFIYHCRRARIGLDDRALRSILPIRGHGGIHRLPARDEGELVAVQPDHPFPPAPGRPNHLPHRQGVQEFVGHQQHRRIHGHGREIVMP